MDGKHKTEERGTLKDAVEALDAPAANDKASNVSEVPASEGAAGVTAGADTSATVAPAATSALQPEDVEQLTRDIIAALKTVFDPEIPSDIYELGLIYKVEIDDDRNVTIDMTLTAPGCPVAGDMPRWVEDAVNTVPGILGTKVNLVFDPPWDQSRMSDEARLAVGMF
ncbi:SUF system Fe-S cluster assembly protein [Hyphomicrobium methylovorum]|nr:SUF system Fe-S cluster assembly protein [Hyphomicrobium methylovorum]